MNLIEDWVSVSDFIQDSASFHFIGGSPKKAQPQSEGPPSNFSSGSGTQLSLTRPFRIVVIR